jgi:hypothetical protein
MPELSSRGCSFRKFAFSRLQIKNLDSSPINDGSPNDQAASYRPYGTHWSLRERPMLGHQPKTIAFDAANLGTGDIQ